MNKTLGERMKEYEAASQSILTIRTPSIIRLDGKAFHTFTRDRGKPFDHNLSLAMQFATQYLVKHIQGCKLGYTQSDEISLLLTDYDSLETEAWFRYNVQKIVSVSASMCTQIFNRHLHALDMLDGKREPPKPAFFDSRVFNLPKEDVCNYFIWRQQDCRKNAITTCAQAYYSHKELHGMKSGDKIGMLANKGIHFDLDIESMYRRGAAYCRDFPYSDIVRECTDCDVNLPDFKEDRDYVEKWTYIDCVDNET
jgi:tRNA(His) 5'-end guanylyltransferase